ncbi:Uncharacterised protein [Mycobacteroides abscessus subsp. abscessus]|nr:Uncharacterised protein [Mycobacteroides abscessus subsp. abscessus]
MIGTRAMIRSTRNPTLGGVAATLSLRATAPKATSSTLALPDAIPLRSRRGRA